MKVSSKKTSSLAKLSRALLALAFCVGISKFWIASSALTTASWVIVGALALVEAVRWWKSRDDNKPTDGGSP